MKAQITKVKERQNSTFYCSTKELEEIRDKLNSIISGEKQYEVVVTDNYDLVITTNKEGERLLTLDCAALD